MKPLKLTLILCAMVVLLATFCDRCIAANAMIQLSVGNIRILQEYGAFVEFHLKDGEVILVKDRGGSYWPPIFTDNAGIFYIGDKVISASTGRLVKDKKNANMVVLGSYNGLIADGFDGQLKILNKNKICTVADDTLGLNTAHTPAIELLKNTSLRFVDSSGPIVSLVTLSGEKPSDTHYRIVSISPDSCRVLSSVDIGNPDYLVELAWSPKGHWWITGSNENILLRSTNAKDWITTKLPSNISETVSSYISSDRDFWVAAIDSSQPLDAGPLIIHSGDGGKTWVPLKWGDSLMREIPPFWLEGQMRAYGRQLN
jgi:hypothetical protein